MITTMATLYSGKVMAEDFQFQTITMNGTGCPEGTTSVIHSPDNKEVSILFDEFMAEVPQYDGDNDNDDSSEGNPGNRFDSRRSHKLCRINIAAKIPEGHKVEGVEISVDFRGATVVERGSMAMFRSVLMDWRGLRGRGSGKNVIAQKTWNRPTEDDWAISENKFIKTNTNCSTRGEQTLNLTMRNVISAILGRRVSPENTSAFISMDSADLAGKLKVKLITKRCGGSSNNGGNGHGNSNGNGNGHGNANGNGNGHGNGHGGGWNRPRPSKCQRGWEFHPRLRRCVRAYSHLVGSRGRGHRRGW